MSDGLLTGACLVGRKRIGELVSLARSGLRAAELSRKRAGVVQTVTSRPAYEDILRLLVWLDKEGRRIAAQRLEEQRDA